MSTGLTLNVSSEKALEAAHVSHPMIASTAISKDDESQGSVPVEEEDLPIKRSNENSGQRCDKDGEKSNTLVAKGVPLSIEQLWDGTIQLNPSVSVSIVAFFRSGERMPNVNWSKSVEVKGKVKLEAFEKYIQDLPRCRNRGLMFFNYHVHQLCAISVWREYVDWCVYVPANVVSLCWKQGSSKVRLEGMKKVAKKYKEENKVGLAKVSPGLDLYVCPRSETIITILAKHGFFKGMTAIEDNKNSLIGCVVWRRNQSDSKCVSEKSEKNTLLSQKSVSNLSSLSIQREAANNVSCAPAALEFNQTQSTAESGMSEHRAERAEQHTCSNSNLLPTNSISTSSQSLSVVSQTAFSHSQSEISGEQLLKVKDPLTSNLGKEHVRRVELQQLTSILPSDVKNRALPVLDIDDLPEFDFGASRGIASSFSEKPISELTFDQKFRDGVSRNQDELLHPTVTASSLNSLPFTSQRRDLLVVASDENEKMPPVKRACIRDGILPDMKNKHSTAMGIAGSISGDPRRKNLFNDGDDDMPEWSPFCVLENQSLANTQIPSTKSNLFYSREPKSTPHDSSAVLRSIPYPSATTAHQPVHYQGYQSASRQPFNTVQHEGRPRQSPLPGIDGKFLTQH